MPLDRFLLFRKKFHSQRVDNRVRNLILQSEDVVQIAVVTFGPDVAVIGTIDQLRRDPDAPACFANASFEHVTYLELIGNLSHIDRFSLEGERSIARHHVQR